MKTYLSFTRYPKIFYQVLVAHAHFNTANYVHDNDTKFQLMWPPSFNIEENLSVGSCLVAICICWAVTGKACICPVTNASISVVLVRFPNFSFSYNFSNIANYF